MKPADTGSNRNRKRSITIGNKRTSVSLEDSFWDSLNDIVDAENITLGDFIGRIPRSSGKINLSSSIRVAVLDWHKKRLIKGSVPTSNG